MIDILLTYDKELFLWLNSLNHPVIDPFMLFISNKYTWVPLYILLIICFFKAYGKKAWWIVSSLLLVVLLADQTASVLFKPLFERLRPCHEEDLFPLIHLPGICGSLYGFASSHAANHFGMGFFLYTFFKSKSRYAFLFIIWALLISYSRIYLGVHYPGDVIAGGLIGLTYSFLVICFMKKNIT